MELLLIRLAQFDHQSSSIDDKKKIKIKPLVEGTKSSPEKVVTVPSTEIRKAENQTIIQSPQKEVENSVGEKTSVASIKNKLSISIKNPLPTQQQEVTEIEQENNVILNESFSPEVLNKAWKEYALKEEDAHLKNTILNVTPQLSENNRILISVFNPDQQAKLHDKSYEIKSFLSQQLKNNQIEIDIQVTENENEFTPHTNRDKFEYMKEKNPSLMELVKNFNLRLD